MKKYKLIVGCEEEYEEIDTLYDTNMDRGWLDNGDMILRDSQSKPSICTYVRTITQDCPHTDYIPITSSFGAVSLCV